MAEYKNCSGKTIPVFATGKVTECGYTQGAVPEGSVHTLKLLLSVPDSSLPLPGQFYMLRSKCSQRILARPISVFHIEKKGKRAVIDFLILKKGKGTEELCRQGPDSEVEMLGPLGNTFPRPENSEKVCIIGGGIGVAPVAGFAESLPPKTYDFFASYKSGSYGLEHIQPDTLTVTTDDGSAGIHGMLPAAIDEEKLSVGKYSAVYACGPAPMLAYVKNIAEKAGIRCWISMESRMACGIGVCLGCTIATLEGNKRCCSDGPVFDSRILSFPKPAAQIRRPPLAKNPDLSVAIGGVRFKNPVIAASGTFGYGTEYKSVFDVNSLGGIASKGLTLEMREGNTGIRVWETPSGLMNSIGLQNPGIPHFIEHELPEMLRLNPVTIANLSGSTLETYVEGAKLLDVSKVPVIELNISCPNVSKGGALWGMTCESAAAAVKAVRAVTKKPLFVKLTPQAPDLCAVAMTCLKEGADALILSNSFQGVAIDIESGRPVFDKIKAGLGGPAIRPIAVRYVYEIAAEIKKLPANERIPVIGAGGIASWQDAVEFIMAGAWAVEVGTGTFMNPNTMISIISGLSDFMKCKGYETIEQMRGCAL